MDPLRRIGLDQSHCIGHRRSGVEFDKQMDVISRTADFDQSAVAMLENTTNVSVQSVTQV